MITKDTPMPDVMAVRDALLSLYIPLSQYIGGSGEEFLVPVNIQAEVVRSLLVTVGAVPN